MVIDLQVRERGPVGRMEQLSGSGEVDQDVGLRRAATSITAFVGHCLVQGSDPASSFLEPETQGLERGTVFGLEGNEAFQDIRGERRTRVFRCPFDQSVYRVRDFLCILDGIENRGEVVCMQLLGRLATPSTSDRRPSNMSLKSIPCGGLAIRTWRP